MSLVAKAPNEVQQPRTASSLKRLGESLLLLVQAKPLVAYLCALAIFFTVQPPLLSWARALGEQTQGGSPVLGQFLLSFLGVAGVAISALPLQLLWPAIRRWPKIATREYWTDVLYWQQGLLLQLLGVGAAIEFLMLLTWGWARGPWLPAIATLPYWVQVLLAIWAYDFIVYWRHRSEHVFRPLWSFHAVHHSALQVDVLTTLRLHPLEVVYASLTNVIVVLAGVDAAAAALAYTLYTYWNYFIHTNVRVRFSGCMKYVLVTPFMHQWHHATDRAAIGKNVGVVFAWNDWLFGTAYHPADWPTKFGVDVPASEHIAENYLRQLVYPLQYAWAQWRR